MKFATLVAPLMFLIGSSSAWAQPHADLVYRTVFYREGNPQWEDLPANRSFSPSILASISKTSGSFVMIGIHCEELSMLGKLEKCRVTADPASDEWQVIGRRMAGEITIGPAFSKRVSRNVKFLEIQIRASNSETSVTNGPCWPPTCHFIPEPPPPPPPPPTQVQ